jgi:hypothetical protein
MATRIDLLIRKAQSLYSDADSHSEAKLDALSELRREPDAEAVFLACEALALGISPGDRELACDLLGALSSRGLDYAHADRAVEVLHALLEATELNVKRAAVAGLGGWKATESESKLLRIAEHESVMVRVAAAQALSEFDSPATTETLIRLSSDECASVRRWAVFGLAWTLSRNGSAVRDTLMAAVRDDDDEVKGEAFIGLAFRRDDRVVSLLREYFESSDVVSSLAIQAAKEIGARELEAPLIALSQWWDVDVKLLEDAINASRRC